MKLFLFNLFLILLKRHFRFTDKNSELCTSFLTQKVNIAPQRDDNLFRTIHVFRSTSYKNLYWPTTTSVSHRYWFNHRYVIVLNSGMVKNMAKRLKNSMIKLITRKK